MPERPEDPNQKAEQEQGATLDFALVARRVSSWTSKGLVSAFILVAGIGFGRQVLRWWSPQAPPSSRPASATRFGDGLGDLSQLHEIRFGRQPWTLRRQTISGQREEAVRALMALCQKTLQTAPLPTEPPGEQEKRFLATLDEKTLIAQEPGQWQLHALDAMAPMAVGVRTSTSMEGHNSSERGGRVVTWGMAFPASEGSWTLFAFRASNKATGSKMQGGVIPIPPGGQRVLGLHAVEGASVEVFQGQIEPEACRAFYDGWFRRHGGVPLGPWRTWEKQWTRRFELPSGRTVGVQLTIGNETASAAVRSKEFANDTPVLPSLLKTNGTKKLQGLLVVSDTPNEAD